MRIRQFENNLYVIQNENKNVFQGKRICTGYLLFIFVFYIGDPIVKRGRIGIQLTGLTLPHLYACPKTGP
jgi:hypothetical protein